jgi:hypothetical protein
MGIIDGLFIGAEVLKRQAICKRLNKCRRHVAKLTGRPYTKYSCGTLLNTPVDDLMDRMSSHRDQEGGSRAFGTRRTRKRLIKRRRTHKKSAFQL